MVDMLLRRYFRGPHLSWAQAVHPVADDERGLLVWLPAGAGFACRTEPDGTPLRGATAIEDYGAAPLRRRTWADRDVLILHPPAAAHSVWWFFREGRFLGWYVNLEAVLARHAGGIDVIDHHLDIVVDPDRTWRWKDEDTFAACVDRPGFWTTAESLAIRAEGSRVAAKADRGEFPFDGTWQDFRPDPAWPMPNLPPSPL
ncbi:DUF402 domain-containing protein [Dactylosporangium sp. CA-052675]|uniref:DUF402 domain-containing protein n=1 Tax=Dactylosporangium sp. CA-052675 TaxID=3239927 RepID=UPI003D8E0C72